MNPGPSEISPSTSKGKGRAFEPTEATPLLGRPSRSAPLLEDESRRNARRSLWRRVVLTFLVFVSICVVLLLAFILLAYSYAAQVEGISPEEILNNAVVFSGPDRIDVINVTADGGMWVQVEGRLGVNAGKVIHVNQEPGADGVLTDIWKSVGRWGIRRLGSVTVNLSTITAKSKYDPSVILATVNTNTIELPLTADPSPDQSWLSKLSVPIFFSPTNNSSAIVEFLRESWRNEYLHVVTEIPDVFIRGGSAQFPSWRGLLRREESNLSTDIRLKIPSLPGLPSPGRNSPFPSIPQLITLKSIDVSSSNSSLSLAAVATIIDPAPPTMKFTTPPLPFIVSLPQAESTIPIASVDMAPFSLTHPNITLNIAGTVLPLPSSSTPVLSEFLNRYLTAEANPIIITSPLFPGISVDTVFPAPSPKPQVLRNVTIRNMRIRPVGKTFLASGTVSARIVLPPGMHVELNVDRVLPDVLVFDGEVPDDIGIPAHRTSLTSDLPVPPPERAFGHIKPDAWLDAESTPAEPEDGQGAVFAVSANIIDVPMRVLPGRQKEFSNFVGKVIFGSGATAGILGEASVGLDVRGLPIIDDTGRVGQMELTGLPFKGLVHVTKRTFFEGQPGVREIYKFMRLIKRILGL